MVGVTGAVGVVVVGARVAEVAGVTTARTVAGREAGGPLETALAAAVSVEVAVRGVGVDRGIDGVVTGGCVVAAGIAGFTTLEGVCGGVPEKVKKDAVVPPPLLLLLAALVSTELVAVAVVTEAADGPPAAGSGEVPVVAGSLGDGWGVCEVAGGGLRVAEGPEGAGVVAVVGAMVAADCCCC